MIWIASFAHDDVFYISMLINIQTQKAMQTVSDTSSISVQASTSKLLQTHMLNNSGMQWCKGCVAHALTEASKDVTSSDSPKISIIQIIPPSSIRCNQSPILKKNRNNHEAITWKTAIKEIWHSSNLQFDPVSRMSCSYDASLYTHTRLFSPTIFAGGCLTSVVSQ